MGKVKWNHQALEDALDTFAPKCMDIAERAKASADATITSSSTAPYNVGYLKGPSKGYTKHPPGRRGAYVSANAPSTKAHEARTNALNMAAGSC